MKTTGHILVFTQWSFKDALVQTYTLPYVDLIREIIPLDIKIFLVTAEQQQIALDAEEVSIQSLDAGEDIEVQLMPLDELVQLAKRGEFQHALMTAVLFSTLAHLGRIH